MSAQLFEHAFQMPQGFEKQFGGQEQEQLFVLVGLCFEPVPSPRKPLQKGDKRVRRLMFLPLAC